MVSDGKVWKSSREHKFIDVLVTACLNRSLGRYRPGEQEVVILANRELKFHRSRVAAILIDNN